MLTPAPAPATATADMNSPTDPTDPPVLTARQLARALQLHPQTIYLLAKEGRLPHIRVGGALRFILADVVAALSVPPASDVDANAGGQP